MLEMYSLERAKVESLYLVSASWVKMQTDCEYQYWMVNFPQTSALSAPRNTGHYAFILKESYWKHLCSGKQPMKQENFIKVPPKIWPSQIPTGIFTVDNSHWCYNQLFSVPLIDVNGQPRITRDTGKKQLEETDPLTFLLPEQSSIHLTELRRYYNHEKKNKIKRNRFMRILKNKKCKYMYMSHYKYTHQMHIYDHLKYIPTFPLSCPCGPCPVTTGSVL